MPIRIQFEGSFWVALQVNVVFSTRYFCIYSLPQHKYTNDNNDNICNCSLFFFFYRQAYNEKPIYTCQICDKQMKNKRSYQRHYNRHGTLQKFACPACPKMFSQEKILKRHEAIHHMNPAKECTDCNEQFVDLIKFKAHRRTHAQPTATKRTYKCDDCGKV